MPSFTLIDNVALTLTQKTLITSVGPTDVTLRLQRLHHILSELWLETHGGSNFFWLLLLLIFQFFFLLVVTLGAINHQLLLILRLLGILSSTHRAIIFNTL